MSNFIQEILGRVKIKYQLAAIPVLFIIGSIGVLLYTLNTMSHLKTEGSIVDIAGRQRMLNQRYLKEILLEKSGTEANYAATRNLFNMCLNAMLNGGNAIVNVKTGSQIELPAAEVALLKTKLLETKDLMTAFSKSAESFLASDDTSPELLKTNIQKLVSLNDAVHVSSNEVVKIYTKLNSGIIGTMINVEIVVNSIIALLGLLFSLLIIGDINTSFQMIIGSASDIGNGDLSKQITHRRTDEIGVVYTALEKMRIGFAAIVISVQQNIEQLISAAGKINATSNEMASGSEEQENQTSEVAAAVEEMTAAILENAKNAAQTAQMSQASSIKAQEGTAAMQETREGMEEIVMSSGKTNEIIRSLAGRAEQIGEVIQVINDIADQTNLLALNAAIEAARAGEQGRGFAVVADEVRKLAERTTRATGEVGDTIKAIQIDTQKATESMVESNNVVNRGKQATVKTGDVLREIMQSVEQAMDMISQIAAATEQMSSGAEEISRNVDAISLVTRESSHGAGALASTAGELTQQTEVLRELVGQFKLE